MGGMGKPQPLKNTAGPGLNNKAFAVESDMLLPILDIEIILWTYPLDGTCPKKEGKEDYNVWVKAMIEQIEVIFMM